VLALSAAHVAAAACAGDCNLDGEVTVDEIIVGVNVALESHTVSACPAMDSNSDGTVTVDEIVAAVSNTLQGCSSLEGSYSGSVDLGGSQKGELSLTVSAGDQVRGQLVVSDNLIRFLRAAVLPTGTLPMTGTFNERSGVFQVSGEFQDTQGVRHTVNISGNLPGSDTSTPFTLRVDDQSYLGSLSRNTTPPATSTATATKAGATPTPPARPTAPPGCTNSAGYTRIVFTDVAGANFYADHNPALELFGVSGATIASQRGITSASGSCPSSIGSPIIGLSAGVVGFPQDLAAGNSYPVRPAPYLNLPYIEVSLVDYSERVTSDILNPRVWRASDGTFLIETLSGSTAQLHVDAHMAPLAGTAATGTFRLQATIFLDALINN
jgi:hypothetical protein